MWFFWPILKNGGLWVRARQPWISFNRQCISLYFGGRDTRWRKQWGAVLILGGSTVLHLLEIGNPSRAPLWSFIETALTRGCGGSWVGYAYAKPKVGSFSCDRGQAVDTLTPLMSGSLVWNPVLDRDYFVELCLPLLVCLNIALSFNPHCCKNSLFFKVTFPSKWIKKKKILFKVVI